jgi:Spy/CpxP family protein refolding chaperone
MKISIRRTGLAATALLGFSAFAAAAAPAPGDPTVVRPPAMTADQPVIRAAGPAMTGHNMQGQVEQRIAALHAKLQISSAQQPQWDQFTQVMRDNARAMDETFQHRVQAMPDMSAPENMQSYAQVALAHAQDMQRMVPAFQALYGSMSDSQKRVADQVFRDGANRGNAARHG